MSREKARIEIQPSQLPLSSPQQSLLKGMKYDGNPLHFRLLKDVYKKNISKICCLLECFNLGTMKHLENIFVGSTFASNLILHVKALQQQQHNVSCSFSFP